MSEIAGSHRASKTLTGRVAGTSSVLQIEYDSVITAVDDLIRPPETPEYLSPGFIDVQVNGFGGVDYNDPSSSHEAIFGSIRKMLETGVTRFFPTIITGPEQRITAAIRNVLAAKHELERNQMAEAHSIEAFHIEGPHISPEDGPRGAHPVQYVRKPDVNEFERWQEAAEGHIRLVTVSPEWPETPEHIAHLVRSGVVASIGHTKATSEQIAAAVDAGATMSTHLGNGAHAVLHKTENYIWDQLVDDRLAASFIIDGIHIPRVFIRAATRAKGVERSVLVTDAVMPAMCEPGNYELGEVSVELKPDGRVVLLGGTRLAGSSLRMDHAIGLAVHLGRLTLREALTMATVNPARVARIAGRVRGLATGEKADFVRFRWDDDSAHLTVVETVVAGTTVYSA
jgi:N-acetylglucosamine-6-phosphate deacetylase